jgi:oxysterol-binding protein-related protein 8
LEFISTPSFILRPESGLETSASVFDRADSFASISDSDDPLERILAVAKFAIGGYSLSAGKSTKKPYNPVLGEIIELVWDMGKAGGRQRYTAEQVSHHPPVAAAVAINKKKGVFMNFGQSAKAKFWGTSVMIKSNGTAQLFLTKFGDETYEFNFPDLKISGFLWGRFTLEWVGTVDIVCQKTGYKCQVEYKPKPWFRGKCVQSHHILPKCSRSIPIPFHLFCVGTTASQVELPNWMTPNSRIPSLHSTVNGLRQSNSSIRRLAIL